jgi:glycosyltransferase involved in cell wall biosynthesis
MRSQLTPVMDESVRIGVVITTYNSPRWLRHVLEGFEQQTDANFTTIIADDGSGEETRRVIEEFGARRRLDLRHVWHEDDGYRKNAILNKALVATECPYLVFTDGDCIPRQDFVAIHRRRARPGHFLSGGYFKMSREVSEKITTEDIREGRVFDAAWLRAAGQPWSLKLVRLSRRTWLLDLLTRFTTTRPTWNGMNSSTWRADLLAINGFNEEVRYFGDDREVGERLRHLGLAAIQIRYHAICMHLDHGRPYRRPEVIRKNRAILAAYRRSRAFWTPDGIEKRPGP